jgi:hypothetical protein
MAMSVEARAAPIADMKQLPGSVYAISDLAIDR